MFPGTYEGLLSGPPEIWELSEKSVVTGQEKKNYMYF